MIETDVGHGVPVELKIPPPSRFAQSHLDKSNSVAKMVIAG
jgi:hypothetical protein